MPETGILFVHGIGTQARGETIVNLGEPLYQALKKWIEPPSAGYDLLGQPVRSKAQEPSQAPQGQVQLVEAVLAPPRPSVPAHARIGLATNAADLPVEWLFAESHWATSFPPPDPRLVTLWLMGVTPWICTSFVARHIHMAFIDMRSAFSASRWLPTGRLCLWIVALVAALVVLGPLTVLLDVLLVGLLLAGFIPLKVVRDLVSRINIVVSSILGDSFVYASSPLRQEAAVSKIARDLDWMERLRGCRNIVIIAHSQGAALAYLCLSKYLGTRVRLFITLGSGLLKLHQLHSGRLLIAVWGCALFVPLSGLMALSVVAHWYGLYDYPVGRTASEGVLGAVWFVGLLAIAALLQKADEELEQQAVRFENDGIKWIDMYAGKDPVPNGPLFLRKTSSPESVEVCNGSSVLADHTSYHKNVDELYLLIVRAIAKYSGTKLQLTELTPRDEAVASFAAPFRRIRTASRSVDELLLLLALVAVLARPDLWTAVGSYVGELIAAACRWVGVGQCWKEPPARSGLILTLLGYALLRLGIAGIAGAWNRAATAAVYNRLNGIGYLACAVLTLYSHLTAAAALSLVILLYYPGQVPYVDALTFLVGDPGLLFPPHYRQGLTMGALAGLVLMAIDVARTICLVSSFDLWPLPEKPAAGQRGGAAAK